MTLLGAKDLPSPPSAPSCSSILAFLSGRAAPALLPATTSVLPPVGTAGAEVMSASSVTCASFLDFSDRPAKESRGGKDGGHMHPTLFISGQSENTIEHTSAGF